jgi:FkbM family methyltransferase
MIDSLFRSLPLFRGKQRLARYLFSHKISKWTNLTISGKFGCVYTVPNLQENIGFEIFINGIYEAETINFIASKIKAGGVFLDMGANIGAISVPVAKLRKDILITSLEAAPWIYEYLKTNVSSNESSNITLINKAISDESGKKVNFFSPKDKFGKGSLAPVFTEDSVEVETISLDELAKGNSLPIDFIKIDVEGFEALAFRGGKQLLTSANAPNILFEFVDWAEKLASEEPGSAQNQLLNFGYRLYAFKDGKIADRISSPIVFGACLIFATKQEG